MWHHLVSLDVILLYTNETVGEPLQIIKQKYKLPDYIGECEQRYKQVEGAPTGAISPVIVNLFL